MPATHTLGIDLGGTNIKGGVLDAGGALVLRHSLETQADRGFEHVFRRLLLLVDEMLQKAGLRKSDVEAVGIGAPGPMSHVQGMIYNAPNLPGWTNIPIRARLAEATGLRVVLENDANAAAFGEFVAGAGRDVHDMVLLTLGTGIGGGIVLNDKLCRGAFDNAGEVGHMVIVPDGRACPCGQRGCLERYSSANAVWQRLTEAVRAGEASVLKPRIDAGAEINAEDVQKAAAGGDVLAARIWDEACRYLALACVNLQHLLNPQQIVLAGGLINAGDALLARVREHFDRLTWKMAPDAPCIELATLGTDAGIIGAAALARAEMGGNVGTETLTPSLSPKRRE